MQIVLYPGSFDPVTVGHIDVIVRASTIFEQVVVGVLYNEQKPSGAFTMPERLELLRISTAGLHNIVVKSFSGLLVDAVKNLGAECVLRGLRTPEDLGPELEMARLNRHISGVETVFLAASAETAYVSAQRVREIGRLGGCLKGLVPEAVRGQVESKFHQEYT